MYDFKRDFSYFIRKEVFVRKVPDISPIQVVNKIRPIVNNIRGTGDISGIKSECYDYYSSLW